MPDTNAQRTRRSRRHRAGDHSLCDPRRCPAADVGSAAPAMPASASPPPALDEAGQRYWATMTAEFEVDELQRPLLLEACRIVDRLDTLDRQLHGHDWLRFRHDESGAEVTVYIDRVLPEAREQATALKGIVAELDRHLRPRTKAKAPGPLADLTARLAARRGEMGPT